MTMDQQRRSRAMAPFNRRQFLKRSGLLVGGVTVSGGLLAACGNGGETVAGNGNGNGNGAADPELSDLGWISPRGTIEVMDDYPLWVARHMGYFDELGINETLEPGPTDALAVTRFVAQEQSDIGFPSPGVLASSIAEDIPVVSIFAMTPRNVFGFAVPEDSEITSVEQLAGKTISLGSAGWESIADPVLAEAGVDLDSIEYVETGDQWGQTAALGDVDAALTWEGLRAQWLSQGLPLKFIMGQSWSAHPSNTYVARASDLDDDAWVDLYTRFLRATVMGLEFGKANPRAAAQLTYREFPGLEDQMPPQVALESMLQLAQLFGAGVLEGDAWGEHKMDDWQDYFDLVHELGQVSDPIDVEEAVTNQFIADANDIDVDRVRDDADSFELDDDFADTQVPSDLELS